MSTTGQYESSGGAAGGPGPGGQGGPTGYGGPGGYGSYGGWNRGGWGMGPRMRPNYPVETKPFLLTSEFVLALIAVIALLITAATNHTVGARFFWVWTSIILVGYMLSRGLAKSGTKSQAWDPRETFEPGRGNREHG